MQVEEFEPPEHIFNNNYAYFSSYSTTWLKHAKDYTRMMTQRFHLNNETEVIEIASNDGYLLQYFKEKNIPVLGIEPSKNVACIALKKGIPTISEFFGVELAKKLRNEKTATLILGNNVLAHVPDINDFVAGLSTLLSKNGIITMEFPHIQKLIAGHQFDTIYHEHFSYFSLYTVIEIFSKHGLTVFDVEELETHGGSLRIFACHKSNTKQITSNNVKNIIKNEMNAGLQEISTYLDFSKKTSKIKQELLQFLLSIKDEGGCIVGYGAPAKGNTLLNYCGIHSDFIEYTVDKSPQKQGQYLPGSRIPVHSPKKILETKPDYILIFPWNIKDEIVEQLAYTKEWGCKLVTPIPFLEIIQ